jgi:tyrosinase
VGWRIHERLQELRYPAGTPDGDRLNATLHRGRVFRNGTPVGWPPTLGSIQQLIDTDSPPTGEHAFWFFWVALEQGWRTHNTGHNFIGGHMGGAFSPNDPIFWLHHANVDRLWDLWQRRRLEKFPGTSRVDHYPAVNIPAPWDGQPAPVGHKLNDLIWPWVGNAQGYATMEQTVADLLPNTSTEPARHVRQLLTPEELDYRYQEPP